MALRKAHYRSFKILLLRYEKCFVWLVCRNGSQTPCHQPAAQHGQLRIAQRWLQKDSLMTDGTYS